jgi:hypothetical protein
MSDVIPLGAAVPPNHSDGGASACAGCGAPLASDQRYCLACGRPSSPVRLAFLDVLHAEHSAATPILGTPSAVGYSSAAGWSLPPDPPGLLGSLRRWSGLFGLLAVLLASLLIGLLVGHWLTGGAGGGVPAKQVIEVKGLGGSLAAAPSVGAGSGSGGASTGGGTGSSSGPHASGGAGSTQGHTAAKSEGAAEESPAEEAEAAKEVTTTKALPAPHKTTSSTLEKIAHTTGKQHEKEVAALGNAPIETGGH